MDLQQSWSRRRRKRLSQAQRQFLLKCLGEEDFSDSDDPDISGPTSDMDVAKRMRFLLGDSEDEGDKDERDEGPSLDAIYTFDAKEMARLSMRNAVNFVFIDDDDEEEDGCTDGIEEVFGFDLEKVAEALRRGADQDELSHIIEEAMIQDLPQRIATGSGEARHEETSSTVTPRTGDLSALMTPPCEAPEEGPVSPQFGGGAVSSTDLAARLQKIGGGACSSRRRRSSIAQHPQLMEAVSTAQSRHRQSLAKVVETELREARRRSLATPLRQCCSPPEEESLRRPSLVAQVRRSVAGAQRRRRSSLIRAAEVLEVAGVGIGQQQAQIEVEEHLDLVQRAVEIATRRHRQSILEAMAQISVIDEEDEPEPMPEAEPESGGATSPRPQSFFQDIVNEIIAVGYEAFRGCIFRK